MEIANRIDILDGITLKCLSGCNLKEIYNPASIHYLVIM